MPAARADRAVSLVVHRHSTRLALLGIIIRVQIVSGGRGCVAGAEIDRSNGLPLLDAPIPAGPE